VGPAEDHLGSKAEVRVAALPATGTPDLLSACRPALPMLAAARSVLETGLSNLGAILHPTITLLNAERIEARQSFDFYAEGVTPAVAAVLAAADEERLRIASAYGVAACSLRDWVGAAYGHHAASLRQAVAGNPAYAGIKAPDTVEHRYLLEDVPTGLVPLLELGEAAGLTLPTLTHLVDRSRALLGGEPWPRPRTLDVLGLQGLGTRGIRAAVEDGLVPVAAGRRPVLRPRIPAFAMQLAFGG
jgi:opine dehydrogenase